MFRQYSPTNKGIGSSRKSQHRIHVNYGRVKADTGVLASTLKAQEPVEEVILGQVEQQNSGGASDARELVLMPAGGVRDSDQG